MFAKSTKAPDVFGPLFMRVMGGLGGNGMSCDMRRHWLLRKYVNQTNPPPLRPLPGSATPDEKPVKALHSPGNSAN